MNLVLGHSGVPVGPHDIWSAWSLHPVAVAGLVAAGWVYRRGAAGAGAASRHSWASAAAAGAVAVALLSPLDALSGVLASAHMVQHVLLMLAAAPLLAYGAPWAALVRGLPAWARLRVFGRPAGRVGVWARRAVSLAAHPATAWLVHVATLWFWHASVPYDAALGNELIHASAHLSLLVTGVWFWRVVLGPRRPPRVGPGLGVLLVFTMALQGVFLSALLTFANEAWYSGYDPAAMRAWGLDPLTDQQLAGLIMWVPAGLVYVGVALALLVDFVRSSEGGGGGGDPSAVDSGGRQPSTVSTEAATVAPSTRPSASRTWRFTGST